MQVSAYICLLSLQHLEHLTSPGDNWGNEPLVLAQELV